LPRCARTSNSHHQVAADSSQAWLTGWDLGLGDTVVGASPWWPHWAVLGHSREGSTAPHTPVVCVWGVETDQEIFCSLVWGSRQQPSYLSVGQGLGAQSGPLLVVSTLQLEAPAADPSVLFLSVLEVVSRGPWSSVLAL
jgi:hypothetical protein